MVHGAQRDAVKMRLESLGATGMDTSRDAGDANRFLQEGSLLALRSARVTAISERMSAMGMPGKPAPEPKSRRVAMPEGRARATAIDSTKWRARMPSVSRIEVRLVRAFQRRISER